MDGKDLNIKHNAKDEEDKNRLKDLRLYTNPLDGLFGYHAKHNFNRDSQIEQNVKYKADYSSMKIFKLKVEGN